MAKQARTDYSSTPLHRKLGIKEESAVLVVSPPIGFVETLGPLPVGAELVEPSAEPADVVILFVTEQGELEEQFGDLTRRMAPAGGLWVTWPKKSSKIPSNLSFEHVQTVGLRAGLVDNKSCAIDQDWQALRFVVRLSDRAVRS